jgi:Protein of unknown function (DUF1189)
MTKYPFFKKIIQSFYSTELYVFVGKSEINKSGFKYLFILLSIFWIPEIIKMQIQFSDFINTELPVFIERLPNIEIKDGVASFDKPSPYVISDDETGKEIMIFDTTGKFTSLDGLEAQILLTQTKLIYRENSMETREYDLSSISEFQLTHEKILSWAQWGKYLSYLLYLVIIPFAFLYRAFQVLIYSLIGLIFQAILQTHLSFQTIYRLCIIAITPAFIADKLLGYFDLDFSGWSFICLLISLSFLYFAMLANKNDANSEPLPPSELGAND